MGGYNGAAVNGRPTSDTKRRIAGELMNDEIPDPRDIIIVSLTDLWPAPIGEAALDRLAPRIRQIARMYLIGQAVGRVVNGHRFGFSRPVRRLAGWPAGQKHRRRRRLLDRAGQLIQLIFLFDFLPPCIDGVRIAWGK